MLERLAPLLHLYVYLRCLRLQSVVLILAEDYLSFWHGADWIHIIGVVISRAAGVVWLCRIKTVLFAQQFVVYPIVVTLLHVISLSGVHGPCIILRYGAKRRLFDREFGVLLAHGGLDAQHGVRPLLHGEKRDFGLLNCKLSLQGSLGELLLVSRGLTPGIE